MVEFPIRKTMLIIEEIHHDGGPKPENPRQRAAMLAIVGNPFAGQYEPDLQSYMDELKPLGTMMSERLIDALGGPEGIDGYGKAAMVGENGELEHTALWHVPGGYAMRQLMDNTKAIVPSAMKQGGVGTRIDIPLGHTNAAYVRSHFDAMEVGLPDGPKANELLLALAMTRGPRIHSRMGGLEAQDVIGEDGLR